MKHNSQIDYWIDLTDYDIDVAHLMLKGGKFLYVGFMCHQVIEKMLKALYVFVTQDRSPLTHNLTVLSRKSNVYSKPSSEQMNLLDTIGAFK